METIEFRTGPDGIVYYKPLGGEEKRLTRFSRDVLLILLDKVKTRFPACYARLLNIYPSTSTSKVQQDERVLRMMERFIRCNFGEHDLLTQDIENDILNFEEVRCPLRGGFCPDENVICRPKGVIHLSKGEQEVVKLYLDGFTFDAIASTLGKKPSTIKTQLIRVKQKLRVKNCREIIRALRMANY